MQRHSLYIMASLNAERADPSIRSMALGAGEVEVPTQCQAPIGFAARHGQLGRLCLTRDIEIHGTPVLHGLRLEEWHTRAVKAPADIHDQPVMMRYCLASHAVPRC